MQSRPLDHLHEDLNRRISQLVRIYITDIYGNIVNISAIYIWKYHQYISDIYMEISPIYRRYFTTTFHSRMRVPHIRNFHYISVFNRYNTDITDIFSKFLSTDYRWPISLQTLPISDISEILNLDSKKIILIFLNINRGV